MKKNALFIIAMIIGLVSTTHSQISLGKLGKKGKTSEPIFEIAGRVPSQPSKLSMHNAYVGKIVFSDQQLTIDNTTESAFKTSFNLGDKIYARVFTSNAVENYMLYSTQQGQPQGETENMGKSYTIYYYVDSVPVLNGWVQYNSESLSGVNTWQRFVNVPEFSSYDWKLDDTREALNKLSPGVHKVKVVIWAGKGKELVSIKPIAQGEFDLNIAEGAKIKIGESWNDLKNGTMASDAKIKAKLLELTAADMKANQPDVTVKEHKIISDDYSIQKDEYNYPKFRYVQVATYAVGNKSGKCFVFYSMYAQDYAGGGTYSSNFYKWGNLNSSEVDCE